MEFKKPIPLRVITKKSRNKFIWRSEKSRKENYKTMMEEMEEDTKKENQEK
jgi:hypothetical protein